MSNDEQAITQPAVDLAAAMGLTVRFARNALLAAMPGFMPAQYLVSERWKGGEVELRFSDGTTQTMTIRPAKPNA